jgi:lipopolysaccharide/colanic/teichoic acid biosynthesis glycosyltransferase
MMNTTPATIEEVSRPAPSYAGRTGIPAWPGVPLAGWRATAKRLLDLGGACLLFPLLLPLWGLLAVLIRLDSPGPALFRQVRIGKNGRPFTLYKLRSMIHNAEEATGPVWAKTPDPRETRTGRYLRRYGVDETLQVINILRGDMSFVGPRPERPFFVDQFERQVSGYALRLLVKPGLTGWAQVQMGHRYDLSIQDVRTKLFYDLEYILCQSFRLDIRILVRTTVMLIGRRGSGK